MKINFFRTILWKLTLYFLLVIFIVVSTMILSLLFSKRQLNNKFIRRIENERIELLQDLLKNNYAKYGNFKNLNISTSQLGKISRTPHLILNPSGKIIISSIPKRPHFRKRFFRNKHFHRRPFFPFRANNFKLTENQINSIKAGLTITNSFKGKHGHNIMYRAYPIISNDKFVGILVLFRRPPPRFRGPQKFVRDKIHLIFLRNILISSLIAAIIAFYLAKNITQPIRMMEKSAKQLSKGDFSCKMNLNRKDELGILSNTFDDMSKKLEKVIKGRIQLMGDISHELRTPLSSIQGCTEAIMDNVVKEKEEKDRYLNTILNQTKRLSLLVDDLLELSKFEFGQAKITLIPFNASQPVIYATESVKILAQKKDIKINIYQDNSKLKVLGDQEKIMRALINLLNNAIQHNPPKTQITISIQKKGKFVKYSVEDNGIQIPQEELNNIFERFHKVDKARTKKESGSGLGLAVTKEIIKAHKSKISVIPLPKGKRFEFLLPLYL